MLKAKHNAIIYPFFKQYTLWKIKRAFGPVQLHGNFDDKKLPVLLVANHVSWWDGFWAMYLDLKVLHREFYFMMLEEQLRKYWFFNYSGGYSVKKSSRSVVETIDYTIELLKGPGNMVLIFPQGSIQSMHQQTFTFEKGVEKILQSTGNPVHVIFQANLVDYGSDPKPGLHIYFQEYTGPGLDTLSIQNSYNTFYRECAENQTKIIT